MATVTKPKVSSPAEEPAKTKEEPGGNTETQPRKFTHEEEAKMAEMLVVWKGHNAHGFHVRHLISSF